MAEKKYEESFLRDYVMVSLAAHHIPDVWDPFFAGSPLDPQNGTKEIITSAVSRAWPVSDAAVGGYIYLLGDPHRHRRLADALAHHALAGGAVRPDDRVFAY